MSKRIKTIKFRLIKERKNYYNIQIKIGFWWKFIYDKRGTIAGDMYIPTIVESTKDAPERIYKEYIKKPEYLRLIKYPTIKVVK